MNTESPISQDRYRRICRWVFGIHFVIGFAGSLAHSLFQKHVFSMADEVLRDPHLASVEHFLQVLGVSICYGFVVLKLTSYASNGLPSSHYDGLFVRSILAGSVGVLVGIGFWVLLK